MEKTWIHYLGCFSLCALIATETIAQQSIAPQIVPPTSSAPSTPTTSTPTEISPSAQPQTPSANPPEQDLQFVIEWKPNEVNINPVEVLEFFDAAFKAKVLSFKINRGEMILHVPANLPPEKVQAELAQFFAGKASVRRLDGSGLTTEQPVPANVSAMPAAPTPQSYPIQVIPLTPVTPTPSPENSSPPVGAPIPSTQMPATNSAPTIPQVPSPTVQGSPPAEIQGPPSQPPELQPDIHVEVQKPK